MRLLQKLILSASCLASLCAYTSADGGEKAEGKVDLMKGTLLLRGSSFEAQKKEGVYQLTDTHYYDKPIFGS